MQTNEELKSLLNSRLAENAASDLVWLFINKATSDNLEVDFHLSEGKIVGDLNRPNTWFQIDAQPGTFLATAKNIISDAFGEEFDDKDPKQTATIDERRSIIDDFRDQVRLILNSGVFHKHIADSLRKVALGDVPPFLVPIDVVRFLNVEIGEACEDDFIVTIQKTAKVDKDTGQWLEAPKSVNEDLFRTHRETGLDFAEIVNLRKAEGDYRYDQVTGVTKKRYSFEIHCDIAADYSFCEPPSNANVRKSTNI